MNQDNNNSTSIFITVIKIIGAIIGFLGTLVPFIPLIKDLVQDTQTLHYISITGFIIFVLAILSIAFKDRIRKVRYKFRKGQPWISFVILYICSCIFFLWVGTWITHAVIIDDMNSSISLWSTYQNEQGTPPKIQTVPGMKKNAMEVSYTVSEDGWVGVVREISPGMLTDTKGIRFFYKGNGAPNTIELKLIYRPDSNGKSAVFSFLWNRATNVQNWVSLEAPYIAFTCWPATGCQLGDILDPNNVCKIDIAISNKAVAGDKPGSGLLLIDEIQGFR